MRIRMVMNVAMTVSGGRLAPCLPGSELWIYRDEGGTGEPVIVALGGWGPRMLMGELLRRDVEVLFCSGIGWFLWGALKGNGVTVVAHALGSPGRVLANWREGRLIPMELGWGCTPGRGGRGCRRRRRGRGGY